MSTKKVKTAKGKELVYCFEYAKCWGKAEAYRIAFPNANPVHAKQYAYKLHKKTYIHEKIQEICDEALGPKQQDLKNIVEFWRKKMNDPMATDTVKLRASEMLAKYHSLFKEESNINIQGVVQIVDDI